MLPHELGHLLPLGEHGPDDELAEGVLEPVTLRTAVTATDDDMADAAAAIVAAAAAVIVAGSRAVVPAPRRQRQGGHLKKGPTDTVQSLSRRGMI